MAVDGHPAVLSLSARRREFGSFKWEAATGGAIRILGSWVADNIETVTVPQLRGMPTYGGTFAGRVQWHRRAVDQLLGFWQSVEDAGLLSLARHWGGSFVPRRVRGSTSLSPHSWGIAFDLNADWNPYNQAPAAHGRPGSVVDLVPIAEAWGFAWGGWFTKHPDGMHFEVYKPGLDEPLVPLLTGQAIKVVKLPGSAAISCEARLQNGVTVVNAARLADALSIELPDGPARRPIRDVVGALYAVIPHLEQGKVYLRARN